MDVILFAPTSALVSIIPSGALEAPPLLKQGPCVALTLPCAPRQINAKST